MAEIAVSSVGNIVQIGLAIREAVELVQQNQEDCDKIKRRVIRATAILQQLEERNLINHEMMSGALEDLEGTLRDALTIVMDCQEKHIACLFCEAGDLSKQLRRVHDDISDQMMTAILAINVHATFILAELQCPAPPQPPQDAEVVESHSNHTPGDYFIGVPECVQECRVESSAAAESGAHFDIPGFRKFSLSEVNDATNGFSEENIIGRGGFGTVYKGVLHDGLVVAIKKYATPPDMSLELLEKELTLASRLQHKNIVKFLGYGLEVKGTVMLLNDKYGPSEQHHIFTVQEYMPKGDLGSGSSLGWSSRFQLIQGIAQGLLYLHEQRVIHLDLKPANILLDSHNNPKINDFGIAQTFGQGVCRIIISTVIGSIGYLAPEQIDEGLVSAKADVYAFGVTLLETISGMCRSGPRRAGSSVGWAWNARESGQMMDFDPSLCGKSQIKDINRCIQIGLLCAQADPRHRPTMADVLKMLNSKRKLPTPKKPGFI